MFWSCWDAFTNQICSSGAVGIGTLLAVGLLVPPVSVRMSPRIGMNVFPYRLVPVLMGCIGTYKRLWNLETLKGTGMLCTIPVL
ncbi:hypothetical protein V6N12_012627 [Hibiscus sabdariffa]|uniref:Uncharacterized protein n=1 Tax=Hibiscus sabdariffa TaxID=183260 RepID=A0ABR2DE30_9ROSI